MAVRRSAVGGALCWLFAIEIALAPAALAASGDLDPSFGMGGVVTSDLGGYDEIFALAVQPDGAIVAAGDTYDSVSNESHVAVARYLPSGALDPSFGASGWTTIDAGGTIEYANDVALQADGKMVLCGGSSADFFLARLEGDGSLDPTFGDDGVVHIGFDGGANDAAGGCAVQPDGMIVAGGYANANNTGEVSDFGVARVDAEGDLDETFGQGGKVATDIANHQASASSMVLQPDGKIVLAGGAGNQGIALARYRPDGTLDPTFGADGISTGLAIGASAEGLALQADGKLVTVGRRNVVFTPPGVFSSDITVERFDADGSLDTDFGSGGHVVADIGQEEWAPAVAIQVDGKIVVGGNTFKDGAGNIVVARYDEDGTPDRAFGAGGIVLTKPWFDIVAVAIQTNGNILAGGLTVGGDADFGLVSYLGSEQHDRLAIRIRSVGRHHRWVDYENSGTLASGDLQVDPDGGQPVAISGVGTLPSSAAGEATVSFDLKLDDVAKKWSGVVTVDDPGAGFSATLRLRSWRFGIVRDGASTRGLLWGFKARLFHDRPFLLAFEIDDVA
jgi:uncharacterized delta-60 repeat protein